MYRHIVTGVLTITALFLVSACNNPVEHSDDEHAEVFGFIFLMGGNEVVTVRDAVVTGSLAVGQGATTDPIEVEFTDEDGDHVHGEDLDDEFSLNVAVADEGMITISETGRWTFTITGVEAGETTLTVALMHGDHADITTPPIPVTID